MSTTTIYTNTTASAQPVNSLPDPPPYTPPLHNYLGTDDEDDEESEPSTNFVIHAPTTVHGSGNIIAVPPPDVPRLTAAVIATIGQKMLLPRHVSVQINCAVNVIGDRNIVGSPAIRPLATNQQKVGGAATTQTGTASAAASSGGARSVSIPIFNVTNVGKRRASEVCTPG